MNGNQIFNSFRWTLLICTAFVGCTGADAPKKHWQAETGSYDTNRNTYEAGPPFRIDLNYGVIVFRMDGSNRLQIDEVVRRAIQQCRADFGTAYANSELEYWNVNAFHRFKPNFVVLIVVPPSNDPPTGYVFEASDVFGASEDYPALLKRAMHIR